MMKWLNLMYGDIKDLLWYTLTGLFWILLVGASLAIIGQNDLLSALRPPTELDVYLLVLIIGYGLTIKILAQKLLLDRVKNDYTIYLKHGSFKSYYSRLRRYVVRDLEEDPSTRPLMHAMDSFCPKGSNDYQLFLILTPILKKFDVDHKYEKSVFNVDTGTYATGAIHIGSNYLGIIFAFIVNAAFQCKGGHCEVALVLIGCAAVCAVFLRKFPLHLIADRFIARNNRLYLNYLCMKGLA